MRYSEKSGAMAARDGLSRLINAVLWLQRSLMARYATLRYRTTQHRTGSAAIRESSAQYSTNSSQLVSASGLTVIGHFG